MRKQEESVEDVTCVFCSEQSSESRNGDEWLKCDSCSKWAAEGCAGAQTETLIILVIYSRNREL